MLILDKEGFCIALKSVLMEQGNKYVFPIWILIGNPICYGKDYMYIYGGLFSHRTHTHIGA